ncbi:MAG: alpha/beta fold hydrolase [Candidatus Eisenbacteria bacterium]|nr:alpha/beta fold hydrolase [Candidatus Eisenbacteria bacterium]
MHDTKGNLGGRMLVVCLVFAFAALAVLCRPYEPRGPVPAPSPVRDYAEAVRRWDAMAALDGISVRPDCRARAMLQGRRTARVVVLFHGLANCPKQFERLADSLFARGCNVLVPRAPYHGNVDRMTDEQANLTAWDLARAADEAVDIAQGLGERVVVAGLSTGGLQAAWVGQYRKDVSRAVLISPVFGVAVIHPLLTPGFIRVLRTLPNRYLWWDPRARENLAGPKQVYPRYSTRALAEILHFGLVVQAAARRQTPAAGEISVITSGSDLAVSNSVTSAVVRDWSRHGARVRVHEFPRSMQVGHDLADPDQPYARPGKVYPVLLGEMDR